MSSQIRPLTDGDFFSWLGLYEGYASFYEETLTDEKALRVWSWLSDGAHELEGIVAVDDEGNLVGLAHFRTFARPLAASTGIFLDDLYVAEGSREAGIGRSLIDSVTAIAAQRGASVVRWITAKDNETARRLYDDVAEKTKWVTYDFDVAPAAAAESTAQADAAAQPDAQADAAQPADAEPPHAGTEPEGSDPFAVTTPPSPGSDTRSEG
ncbi:GNAT family N-acetyltransferase [Compostimonas suwonensis]|uniref:L-amino acid N-acyltransferase YncA n=1 Tax=Compostimonas suwonensis TaxID=1048394 RepID=A0A2M9BZF9_9MICO|nr:GNAT family N-acetyltransferase [Compostimonas suwonensis]PJJ63468.1 L-amino acid N-acyltransferase YncA [Compostimonas suwonensis]